MELFTRKKWGVLLTSLILTCVISGITFITLNDFGIVWDEPIYFVNGDKYWEWLKNPSRGKISSVFAVDPKTDFHPPLRKVAAGITHDLLTTKLRILDNTRGYRVSAYFFLVPFIFTFTIAAMRKGGTVAGIIISVLMAFHPVAFALANLVTLDYATMVLWFGIGTILVREKKTRVHTVLVGFLLGLSLLTKSHGILFGAAIVLFCLADYFAGKHTSGGTTVRFPVLNLGVIFCIALVVLIAGWPYLWENPVQKYTEYLVTQKNHPGVASIFYGTISHSHPFYYVPWMLFMTMPAWSLVIVAGGIIRILLLRKWEQVRFLLPAVIPIAIFMLPGVKRYDGVRLFLPALPFLFLNGALFVRWLVNLPKFNAARNIVAVILCLITAASVWYSTVQYHPYELSFYSELTGGIQGAYKRGIETEYWGSSFKDVLPYMNDRKGTMFCVFPVTSPFYYYQAMGALAPGVIFEAGRGACTDLVVLMRRGLFPRDPSIEPMVKNQIPEYSVVFKEVPLVSVYKLQD